MQILEILKDRAELFVIDDIEGGKIKKLVEEINKNIVQMHEEMIAFATFKSSQIDGEYNRTLVMAKSLKKYYADWHAVEKAYLAHEKQEVMNVSKYLSAKDKLIGNLQTLLKEVKKDPVVSAFDVRGSDFVKCEEGREIIILGSRNNYIIESLVKELDNVLVAKGYMSEIASIELSPDYSKVMNNVKACNDNLYEIYGNTPSKITKLNISIESMKEVGKKVVFFETYKGDLLKIGCLQKELDAYEKQFTKEYIPLKKQLQKELRVEFDEICDIQVNEELYNVAGEKQDLEEDDFF